MKSRMGMRKRMGGGGRGMGKGSGTGRGMGRSGYSTGNSNGIVKEFLDIGKDLVNGIMKSRRSNSSLITNNIPNQMNRQITVEEKSMGLVAVVDTEQCVGCGRCLDMCPVGAVYLNDTAGIDSQKCTGCGTCVEECPRDAIKLAHE